MNLQIINHLKIKFMKILIYTLLLSLFCTCAFAQDILGKWSVPAEGNNQLFSLYESVDCTYKFKKNGDLIIKISGIRNLDNGRSNPDQYHLLQGVVEIKGKYSIEDGKISSIVENDGVKTYASDSKSNYGSLLSDSVSYIVKAFGTEDNNSKRMENELRKRLLDYRFLWDWNKEPITITKKELVIGDKLRCKK